jgi:hypothetical protein
MADSKDREHKRDLTEIRPDLVSLVDLGANGEPFFLMKRAPEGGTMSAKDKVQKNDDAGNADGGAKTSLPSGVRTEMAAMLKVLAERTKGLVTALKEMKTVSEGDVHTPAVVASKIMAIQNDLSTMLGKECNPEHEEKSFASLLKSEDEYADATMIESNRDKMVAVLSSVGERLAALIDALEGEEYEDEPTEMLTEILGDIVSLTEQFPPMPEDEDEESEDEDDEEEMTASRISRLRKASSRLTELAQGLADCSAELAKALEDGEPEGEDMANEDKKKSEGDATVEKSEGDPKDPIATAIEGLQKSIEDGIGEVKKSVEDLTTRLDATDEKVQKMERAREPASGGGPDESVKKSEGDGGGDGDGGSLFGDIMPENLRGTVSHT